MQTVLMHHAPAAETANPVPPLSMPHSGAKQTRKVGSKQLDSLLKTEARPELDLLGTLDLEPTVGAFQGLRVAMLFNAALGIAGLVGYEAWTMMAR